MLDDSKLAFARAASLIRERFLAGTILQSDGVRMDWYIPNERLIDPRVGNEVYVLFGNRRIPGKIAQILPVSGVYAGTQQLLARDRPATQIARIRFDPDALPPPLNTTVDVRMHYTEFFASVANVLVRLFGLH
jgi:HlyD family secretion protein